MSRFAERLHGLFFVKEAGEARQPTTWKSIAIRGAAGLVGWVFGTWSFHLIQHRPLDVGGVTFGAIVFVVATMAAGLMLMRKERASLAQS